MATEVIGLDVGGPESEGAEDSEGVAKEDLFSSTEENLLSAEEKSVSAENLNSQLDDYKTTNAPDSNDKQQLEPAVRSANLSNCGKLPPPQGKRNQQFPSHKVID